MARIRVLVVDDSVVIRKLVADALASDPDIEVVGTASNGRIALNKLELLNPDIVTLDIEMPELDGLETLRELRKTQPRLPVIMFSTLTERGAVATLDALAMGASDYVTKPSNLGSVAASQQRVRDELIPKIRSLCWRVGGLDTVSKNGQTAGVTAPKVGVRPRSVVPRIPKTAPDRTDLVVIGVSTGGPNALDEVLTHLPATLPVPIVIVQHMPGLFTRLLAQRLQQTCALHVEEGANGALVRTGSVYIAPGGHHLFLRRDGITLRLCTSDAPPENFCRPAVDVLFRSAAELVGTHTLGIVLTGMGKDGLRGAESICDAGGSVLAQDQQTSVVWGMPGFVATSGFAEKVLPLNQVAGEILRRVAVGRPEFNSGARARKTATHQPNEYRYGA